jgi:hypothetical protein
MNDEYGSSNALRTSGGGTVLAPIIASTLGMENFKSGTVCV